MKSLQLRLRRTRTATRTDVSTGSRFTQGARPMPYGNGPAMPPAPDTVATATKPLSK
ncbi:MAG: hypothetical protein U0174_20780 [Polyangiaceae bacterium]